MDILEKVCIQSYTAPSNLEKNCVPHNFLFDLPLQSREVSKQIDVFKDSPCFQSMKLSSSMTLPVFEPIEFNFCDLQKDPVQCIKEEKEEFLFKLRGYFTFAQKQEKDSDFMRNISTTINKSLFAVSEDMVKLTDCLALDPHPYFSESYVWLPVGGSIKNISLGNKVYLLTPDGNKYEQIRAIPAAETQGGWERTGPITRVDCSPGGRILQVVTSKHKKRGYVGVRQLRGFHVMRLKPLEDDGSLKARKVIDVLDPSEALIALDISSQAGEHACTIDTLNSVKIYDISAGTCIVDQKIVDTDQPNSRPKGQSDAEGKFIQFSKQPYMMYIINKRKLYFKDIREPFQTSGTTFNVYDLNDGCEILSVSAESEVSDMLYCSSTHHCYVLDPRRGWVKRWNHGLDNMPIYLDVGVTEPLKEMVVTASVNVGSATGILNTWKENENGIGQSVCSFPATMPSIRDTAFWANSKGLWLEPSIIKRTESSLTGITVVPSADGQGCSLFSLNAVGDVFCTTFRPDKMADEGVFFPHNTPEASSGGVERIREWQEGHMKMMCRGRIDLHCETLTDRSYLRTIMKQHLNSDAVAREHVRTWKLAISRKKNAYRSRPRLTIDKPLPESRLQKLSRYKDSMASEILPVWNMDLLITQARTYSPECSSALLVDSDDSSSDDE